MTRRTWWLLSTAMLALSCELSGVLGQPGDGGAGGGSGADGGSGAGGGLTASIVYPCDNGIGPVSLNAGPGSALRYVAPDAGWVELTVLGRLSIPGTQFGVLELNTVFYNDAPATPLVLPLRGTFESISPRPELRPTVYPTFILGAGCNSSGFCDVFYLAERGEWSISDASTSDVGVFAGVYSSVVLREFEKKGRAIADGGCLSLESFQFRARWP
jgi:hypothetical protein